MTDNERIEEISKHIEAIICLIGEDPEREGLRKTPMRYAKALSFITQGYDQDPAECIRQAVFEYSGSKMVVVKDIEFYSMCEHLYPALLRQNLNWIPSRRRNGRTQ